MFAIIPSFWSVSGVRPSEFKFRPHTVVMWGWGVVSGCLPQHQPSSFFLLISSLLPGSSLRELLSFPLAGNESRCLWCEGEPGRGNNGAEGKCQPRCTRVRARFRVFSVCVRVIKDPIRRTHQAPLNPCRGIKQCCRSKRALFSRPPTPPLSSFVFHFSL